MPRNPMYNSGRTDAQNNGLTHDNKSANPQKHYSQGMNEFNLSYKHATTERFADVSPFMVLDVLGRDEIPFRSIHELSSYTMKSPNMDEIYKHKFYSLVPYRAILPNTWELFYTNPTHGDDVPDDSYCNFNLVHRWLVYTSILSGSILQRLDTGSDEDVRSAAVDLVKFFIATESIFSCGSLLTKLKYNFWTYLFKDKNINYDVFFDDNVVDYICTYFYISREVQPNVFVTYICNEVPIGTEQFVTRVSKQTFLDFLREGDYSSVLPFYYLSIDVVKEITREVFDKFDEFISSLSYDTLNSLNTYDIDLSRVIAYQITCVSQVTDSSIDYLFNAQLFRDVLFPRTSSFTFEWNGQVVMYDTFSKKYFTEVWFNDDNFVSTCCKLFSYAKSLKYGDYFTNSRPKPLANGDITIDTSDGLDALEITRKIVYTRFLNWNNRVGPDYNDYYKELTGMSPLPDPTEPSYVSHSKSIVGKMEVENTGEAQIAEKNSVTTLLRDTNGNFEFDIIISEPSILLGLTSYDMERLYTRGMDRANLKESRHDFFNHMMQYVGDQDIKACELSSNQPIDRPVAYTTRDMHYKMNVNQASGGFIFGLPSWAFTTEESDIDITLQNGLNPLFIRNLNNDFDRFYSSLTGYSLGTYFHFIVKYKNDFTGMKRAMDVAPDIL